MKKTVLIFAVVLFTTLTAFCHGIVTPKHNKDGSFKKVFASARANSSYNFAWWNRVMNDYEKEHVYLKCAWQEAWYNSYYEPHTPGAVYRRYCSRGGQATDLTIMLSSALDEDTDDEDDTTGYALPIEESNLVPHISVTTTGFSFSYITGNMKISKPAYMFSSYEIIVWKPTIDTAENIEDTVIDENEILCSGSVKLTNNALLTTGFFSGAFDTITIDSIKTASYSGSGYTYTFNPTDTPFELAYTVISDGGADDVAMISGIQQSGKEIKNIDVFPNPSSEYLNIKLPKDIENDYYSIKMFDNKGTFIKSVLSYGAVKGGQTIKENISQLPDGYYYLLIQNGNNKISLKKFNKL